MLTKAWRDCRSRPLIAAFTVAVGLLFAGNACGGGGAVASLKPALQSGAGHNGAERGAAILISEVQIASLPAWQQELLSDPGWNEPYLAPRTETPIEPPTHEMLKEDYRRVKEKGIRYNPRGFGSDRSTSWMDIDPWIDSKLKGEYDLTPRDVDPPYGCNSDGENGIGDSAFDDVIRQGTQHLPETLSYVLEGNTEVNHFNATGGSGNDALSAVYQLFATSRTAIPRDWIDPANTSEFEELTYRSDLAPGVPPGGDCGDAEAYLVEKLFWKRFNSLTDALPNGQRPCSTTSWSRRRAKRLR